jgi:hypothetical protein
LVSWTEPNSGFQIWSFPTILQGFSSSIMNSLLSALGLNSNQSRSLAWNFRYYTHSCINYNWIPGLPDFSWYKIPNQGKYTKLHRTTPNDHKI